MSINDTQTLSSAKEKDYSELDRVLHSYKLNPPKMFNILWRDKFSKDLIRMNKRYLRASTQILTEHACLNYHLNRSVQPLCPLCEAEYYTVLHLLAQFPMLWQLRVDYFDTHYTIVTDIVDRYNQRRIICYMNRTNQRQRLSAAKFRKKNWLYGYVQETALSANMCGRQLKVRFRTRRTLSLPLEQTVWSSERQVERSRNSILLLYDLDLSSLYLRLGSFAMRSGPCLDNC